MRGFFSEPKKLTDSDVDRIIDKNPRFGSFIENFDAEEDDVVVSRNTKINPNVYGTMSNRDRKIWGDRVVAMNEEEMRIFLTKIPTDIIFDEVLKRYEKLEESVKKMSEILKED